MAAYDFLTNMALEWDRHRELLIDDIALSRRTADYRRGIPRGATVGTTTRLLTSSSLPQPTTSVAASCSSNPSSSGLVSSVGQQRQQSQQQTSAATNGMSQRCVLVCKAPDGAGFGLSITTEQPISIADVAPQGAAQLAGVRAGDRLLKVNGIPVAQMGYEQVVELINSGQQVALTLFGRAPPPPPPLGSGATPSTATTSSLSRNNATTVDGAGGVSMTSTKNVELPARIEAMINCDAESKENWRVRKRELLSEMLEEERKNIENLRDSPSVPAEKLEQALRRVESLRAQLRAVGGWSSPPDRSATTGAGRPSRLSPPSGASPTSIEGGGGGGVNAMRKTHSYHFSPPSAARPPPHPPTIPSEDGDSPETPGPFTSVAELKKQPAHLAVFISHLVTDGDPASLLFYLLTDSYVSLSATVRDVRRWAYELFSAFLIPNSPLYITASDQQIIQPIDKLLSTTASSVADSDMDALRRIFAFARQKALGDANDRLREFRHHHQFVSGLTAALSPDTVRAVIKGDDPEVTQRAASTILIRALDALYAAAGGPALVELDSAPPRLHALIVALTTVVRSVLQLKPANAQQEKLLDRAPLFLAKDRSGRLRTTSRSTKRQLSLKGHSFSWTAVLVSHYCYQCRDAVWGVAPHAYFCLNCDLVLHKECTAQLVDACYPAAQQQHKTAAPVAGSSTTPSKTGAKKSSLEDEAVPPLHPPPPPPPPSSSASSRPIDVHNKKRDEVCFDCECGSCIRRRTQSVPKTGSQHAKSCSSDSGICTVAESAGTSAASSDKAGRSHSMRSRDDALRESRRGRSAMSWGSSIAQTAPTDEAAELLLKERTPLSAQPPSQHQHHHQHSQSGQDAQSVSGSSSISHHSSGNTHDDERRRALERANQMHFSDPDSDLEVETDVPSLESLLGWEVVRHLKPKEKKRQEVINELFHTERTHVRNLKVLYKVFYQPILANRIVSLDFVDLLFANLGSMLDCHQAMLERLTSIQEQWRRDASLGGQFGTVGDLFVGIFEGELGARFVDVASTFCQHQQYALDMLRARCSKKEERLTMFLVKAEQSSLCRKLQLKDMVPVEMQRLVKYPLLLDTIAKYTPDPSPEYDALQKAAALSRALLGRVNAAKRQAENQRRLDEIDRRLDTAQFDREHPGKEFATMQFSQCQLIHDGPLTFRLARGKTIDLHVVLLDSVLMLLTKHVDGNRYVLKNLEPSKEAKWPPLVPLASLLVKEKPNDKRAIIIVFHTQLGPQINEFVASTHTERRTWFKLLSDQIEYVRREISHGIIPYNIEVAALSSTTGAAGTTDPSGADAAGAADLLGPGGMPLEKVHVLTHPRLVHASEITVRQPTILEHAQPVCTPSERLRKADQQIFKALLDKQAILAEFLVGDKTGRVEELEALTEALTIQSVADLKKRDGRELAMSAIVHGNRLIDAINSAMNARRVDETSADSQALVLENQEPNVPSVACYRLTTIAAPLINHLKAMMHYVQEQQTEMSALRQQLRQYQDVPTATTAAATSSLASLILPPSQPPPPPPGPI